MAHPRKLVRDAIVAALAGKTSAGPRVQATRIDPYKRTELPAISVYTLAEQVDSVSAATAPRELTRALTVEIAGWIAHSAAHRIDDAMDELATEIEAAMDADPYLGGAAGDSLLESIDQSFQDEGDPLIGVVVLTYSVTYRTDQGQTAVDDFLTAGATTRIVGADDNNAIHDVIVVRETP
ncbi:MAG TPA: hypothetical protein VFK02_06585 [Kofleriaceae bacterium]|nr:hypothetical protein [Kofleriaceae bacterium]